MFKLSVKEKRPNVYYSRVGRTRVRARIDNHIILTVSFVSLFARQTACTKLSFNFDFLG